MDVSDTVSDTDSDTNSNFFAHNTTRINPPRLAKRQGPNSQSGKVQSYINMQTTDYDSSYPRPNFNEDERNDFNSSRQSTNNQSVEGQCDVEKRTTEDESLNSGPDFQGDEQKDSSSLRVVDVSDTVSDTNSDTNSNSFAQNTTRTNPPRLAKRQGPNSQSGKEQSYINMQTTDYESSGPWPNFNEDEHDDSNSSRQAQKQSERQKRKKMHDKLKEMEEEKKKLETSLEEEKKMKSELEEKSRKLETSLEAEKKKKNQIEESNQKLERSLKVEKKRKNEMEEKNKKFERLLEEEKKMKNEMEEKNKQLESLLQEAEQKNIHYFNLIISVLVLVPLCIGLRLAFKGHEMNHIELRLMLVGKTGAGKSASGNTILGEEAFRVEASPASVTATCMKRNKVLDGRNITIIDTPGVMDTWLISNQTAQNAHECISMYSPEPHMFLLVIRLGRFTVEESNSVKWIQENFGEEALKFTMILFTGGDLLEGKTVEKFISNSYDLQNLVDTCEGKYHVFNNYDKSNRTQVTELFKKINVILHKNIGYFYTKEVHQKVQRSTREEEERKRVILEKEIKMEEEKKRMMLQEEIRIVEEKKRAVMEKLIREEGKIQVEQLANELKAEAQRECNIREKEIRYEEELNRKLVEEEMKMEQRRKVNEIAINLRDEQLDNKNLKAELEHAYGTSFWFKVSTVLLILILIIVVMENNKIGSLVSLKVTAN